MKKKYFLLLLTFHLSFLASVWSQSQQDRFMLMWYDHSAQNTSISTMTQQYKDMQDHYFNSALVWFRLTHTYYSSDAINLLYASSQPSKAFMDSAYNYNIKIILTTPDNCLLRGPGLYGTNSYDSLISQEGLAYWGNHPALWGFHIYDEPDKNRIDFHDLIPYSSDIKDFNPNLIRYINFLPMYVGASRFDYETDLPFLLDSIQTNILSFDRYPLYSLGSQNDLFNNLDVVSRKSVEYGFPFNYVFTSLIDDPNGHSIYNPDYVATAYFMYAGLFYGAKGLSHWNGNKFFNNAPLQLKVVIKEVNKKITENEDVLLSLQFQSAYHIKIKSTIKAGDEIIPSYSAWANFSSDPYANEIFKVNNPLIAMSGSTIDSLAVSFLTDNFGNRYFWIFNKSLSSTEIIKLNLKNGSGVVDILSGNYCLLQENAYIQFEPAEAKLFKFIPNKDSATINEITVNTIWEKKKVVSDNIVINPSVTLTIMDTVLLGANTSITIHLGGKLIIDGGTITNACEDEMWQGITVMGDPNQPLNPAYQGYVEILNGGKIENSVCAVKVKGGGIVSADNAHFLNNKAGVKFEEVIATNSGISGSFTNTNFIIDNNYLGNSNSFQSHLNIQGNATVSVSECSFSLPQNFYNKNSIIVKNASTNWANSNYLNRSNSILLQEGAKLTHTGTIFCADNVNITVSKGGELMVDGGKLTNLTPDTFWQGVTVHGRKIFESHDEPDTSKAEITKGLVQILNGGTIENAIIGINAKTGGMVYANFATFLNNQTGVWFKPLPSNQSGSSGTFISTFFKLNNNFMGNQGEENAHFIMDNCGTVAVSGCIFSKTTPQSNGIVINNTTTNWTNDNILLSVPLTLHSGAILNNTGNIYSNINTNIEVYPNAKLIIDGGSLSSDLERPRGMWQGVTLYGGSSSNNTEMIQLINGGTIENALCGITVNDYATVTADDAHFLNNTIGIKFNTLKNNSTFTSGTFNNTNFELNNRYLGTDPFDVHLFMENSGSVNINNSIFSSTANKKTTTKNRGIVAQSSGLIISDIYGPGAGTNCQFNGFNTAISATTKGGAPVFKVYDGIFDNNLYGIEVLEIDNIEITNNEFNVLEDRAVGVSITHSTGYKIEANYFTGTGSDSQLTFGLHISDSGTDDNKVYLNTFYGLSIGQLFSGINADKDTGIGLQSLCNSFRGNSGRIHDIYIGRYPVNDPGDVHLIATDQGNADVPAGNTFDATNSFIINISNNSAPVTNINYYHGPGNLELPSYNYLNPILVPESAKCGSKSREEENEVSGMRYEVSGEDEVSGVRYEVSGENLRESVSSVSSACKENDIILIPNPTTGELRIENGELRIENVEVFDIYGKNLTPHTANLAPQTSLDISNLASGVYFVKIYTNAGVVTKKVIKN